MERASGESGRMRGTPYPAGTARLLRTGSRATARGNLGKPSEHPQKREGAGGFEATGPRERGVSIKLPGYHTARKVRHLLMELTALRFSPKRTRIIVRLEPGGRRFSSFSRSSGV